MVLFDVMRCGLVWCGVCTVHGKQLAGLHRGGGQTWPKIANVQVTKLRRT